MTTGDLRPAGARAFVGPLIGNAPAMGAARQRLASLLRSPIAVVRGEHGTGRRHAARWLHAQSEMDGPLVELRIAELAPQDRLRAIERGLERASETSGALYVHDLADLAEPARDRLGRLLRAARGWEKLPRAIFSTTAELRILGDRLAPILLPYAVELPALRDRPGDDAMLATHFLERTAVPHSLASDALTELANAPWPGNARQLLETLRVAAMHTKSDCIDAAHVIALIGKAAIRSADDRPLEELLDRRLGPLVAQEVSLGDHAGGDLRERVLALVDRPLLRIVMEQTRGNQLKAAQILGITRNTLRTKLLQHGLLKERVPRRRA